MTEITTERLILRKATSRDKNTLIREIGAWDVAKWLTRVPYPYTEHHADEFLLIIKDQPFNVSIFRQHELIGGVVLNTNADDQSYELGYWLGVSHWGHGYTTEAVSTFLSTVKKTLDTTYIKASYITGNDASAHVLRKLGFHETDTEETYCLPRKKMLTCVTLRLATSI